MSVQVDGAGDAHRGARPRPGRRTRRRGAARRAGPVGTPGRARARDRPLPIRARPGRRRLEGRDAAPRGAGRRAVLVPPRRRRLVRRRLRVARAEPVGAVRGAHRAHRPCFHGPPAVRGRARAGAAPDRWVPPPLLARGAACRRGAARAEPPDHGRGRSRPPARRGRSTSGPGTSWPRRRCSATRRRSPRHGRGDRGSSRSRRRGGRCGAAR